MKSPLWQFCLTAIALFALVSLERDVYGQTPAQRDSAKRSLSRQPFSLRISSADVPTFSLKAQKAPLVDIASEVSQRLNVPVMVGSSVAKSEVSADFRRLMIEPAMQLLAPAVYIDYEMKHETGRHSKVIGIYLGGYADPPPAMNAGVKKTSHVVMLEGNTEDGGAEAAAKENDALNVSYEGGLLTVKAKRQPVSVVLSRIAQELHIPFDDQDFQDDLVNLDLSQIPVEDAVSNIAPNVRLYVRANLQSGRRVPFRISLMRRNK